MDTQTRPRQGLHPFTLALVWLIAIAIPLVFLRISFYRLIERDESLIAAEAQRILSREMEEFEESLRIKSQISDCLRHILRRLNPTELNPRLRNTPGVTQSITKSLAQRGSHGENLFDANFLHRLRKSINRELGVEPLALFAAEADLRNVSFSIDPRRFSPMSRPTERLARRIMAWRDEGGASDETPEQKNAVNAVQNLLGQSVRPPFHSGDTLEFFTEKFGGDILIIHALALPSSPSFSRSFSPSLSSPPSSLSPALPTSSNQRIESASTARSIPPRILAVFRASSFSLRGILKRARSRVANPDCRRGYTRTGYFMLPRRLPRIRRTSHALVFSSLIPTGVATHRDRYRKTIFDVVASGTRLVDRFSLPAMVVSMPLDRLSHPLRQKIPFVDTLVVLLLAGSAIGLLRLGLLGGTLPLNLRGKLFLVFGLAMSVPLIAFWMSAWSYFRFSEAFSERRALGNMTLDLENLETGANNRENFLHGRLWQLKREVKGALTKRSDEIKTVMEKWEKTGLFSGMYLLRFDGTTIERGACRKPDGVGGLTRDTVQIMKALSVIQLTADRSPYTDPISFRKQVDKFRARLEQRGNAVNSAVFSRIEEGSIDGQLNTLFSGHDRLFPSPLFSQADTRLCYMLLSPENTAEDGYHALLWVTVPYDFPTDQHFRELAMNPRNFTRTFGSWRAHLAIFKTDTSQTRLLPPLAFSPHDPTSWELARKILSLGTDAAWREEASGSVALFAGHAFKGRPYIAVAIGEPLEGAAHQIMNSMFLRGLVVYSLLILWLLTGLLTDMLGNPIEMLLNGIEAIRSGRFGIRVVGTTGDEFDLLTSAFNGMSRGLLERERMERFVSRQVADAIKALPDAGLDAIGHRTHPTVLISDIRNFTTLTERHPPQEIVALLNSYFTEMEPAIVANGGMIDKLIGDAIQAVFFPDETSERPGIRACKAAVDMRRKLATFNQARLDAGLFAIETGIGIAEGDAISGQVGSRRGRLDFTVIGEPVQNAGRLELLSKQGRSSKIIITTELSELVKDRYSFDQLVDGAVELLIPLESEGD
ncbi:MAG: adenylate/guanylate cyclase domain-containing protein [Candidatus Ozemobacteraceae bacterium]